MMQHLAARSQRIGSGCLQADMSVAVGIDTVFDDIHGQHLDHADLAGPGAGGRARVKVVGGVQLHRGQHLRAEKVGAAAVVGQRGQRVGCVKVTLKRAIVRFKRPEGQQHGAVDAIGCFDVVKDAVVLLGKLFSLVQPLRRDQAARKLDERFLKHALRLIGFQHRRVLSDA